MKQVWKCDFCSKTSDNPDLILSHESNCTFNKKHKNCYSCKYRYEGMAIPDCELDLDIISGEDEGNCKGWVYVNIDRDREEKLNKLGL